MTDRTGRLVSGMVALVVLVAALPALAEGDHRRPHRPRSIKYDLRVSANLFSPSSASRPTTRLQLRGRATAIVHGRALQMKGKLQGHKGGAEGTIKGKLTFNPDRRAYVGEGSVVLRRGDVEKTHQVRIVARPRRHGHHPFLSGFFTSMPSADSGEPDRDRLVNGIRGKFRGPGKVLRRRYRDRDRDGDGQDEDGDVLRRRHRDRDRDGDGRDEDGDNGENGPD